MDFCVDSGGIMTIKFSDWLDDNKSEIQKYKKVYIYGAGRWGRRVYCHFLHCNIHVDGFVTSDVPNATEINRQMGNNGKYIKQLREIKTYHYNAIKNELLDAYIIIAINGAVGIQIENHLEEDGIFSFYRVKNLDCFFENQEELSDEKYFEYLPLWYWEVMNVVPNLANPQTFTEKIQCIKSIYSRREMSRLADKYAVREWIEEKIGSQYLVPMLGVWDNCEDIDYEGLPQSFVLKCNHGSGMNIVVKDKSVLDFNKVTAVLSTWMAEDFSRKTLELHYKYIEHKVIAEQYIEELDGNLYDYKIHCFGGEPLFIQCIGNRNLEKHEGYQCNYDLEWNELNWIFEDYPRFNYKVDRPNKLEEMIQIARILSKGFSYVRVDLYNLGAKVYFGEMTFTPASGVYIYKGSWSEDIDCRLGNCINII